MERIILLVTLLGCCLAATLAVGQSVQRDYEMASLPAYEEGYYYNKQFQKKKIEEESVQSSDGSLLRSSQGTSERENVRRVVDSKGRYWVVAEPVNPEPGFYLNKQFQKDLQLKPKIKVANRVYIFKKDPQTAIKKIVEVQPNIVQVPDAIHNTQKFFPGLVTPRTSSVQYALPAQERNPVFSYVSRDEVGSSTDGLVQRNRPNTVGSAATGSTRKSNTFTVIAHPPQVDPSPNQRTDDQMKGFSCDGKEFGYYSDVESNCQKYHVCNPVDFGNGFVKYYKYSFSCTGSTRWDPARKICATPETASPCQ